MTSYYLNPPSMIFVQLWPSNLYRYVISYELTIKFIRFDDILTKGLKSAIVAKLG